MNNHPLASDWSSMPATQPSVSQPPTTAPAPSCPDRSDVLKKAIINVDELRKRNIKPREILMHPFIREGNLGFIYGPRGHGKTWVSLMIASTLTSKNHFGPWHSPCPVRTLLVDGEVDIDETQERLRLLKAEGPMLEILHHQDVFDASEGQLALNLADPEQQDRIIQICQERGIKVLILDNLSSLLRGVAENDGDHWEPISHWLLDLRRMGVSVIIVHHAGRNGNMRGHSRREDPAHWIIKVEKADSDRPDLTAFTVRFEKYRRSSLEATPLRFEIQRISATEIATKCSEASDRDIFVQHVLEGVESATEIAELMSKSKGQISKLAKRAEAAGLIKNKGGRYLPPAEGNENGNDQKP